VELTEKERARWEAFKKTYSRDKTKIERVKKIIEKSAAGHSKKDIYSEVEPTFVNNCSPKALSLLNVFSRRLVEKKDGL